MNTKRLMISALSAAALGLAMAGGVQAQDGDDSTTGYSGYGPGSMMGGYGMGPGMMGGYGGGGYRGGGYGGGGYGMGPGMMGGYGMGPGMMGGYGMGPGMMGGYGGGGYGGGGYGMGPGMMGGYGMGPGMMGGYGMGPGMMGGYGPGYGYGGQQLSPEKQKELQNLHQELWQKQRDLIAKIQQEQQNMQQLYAQQTPDADKIGEAYDKIAALQKQMLQNRIEAQNKAQEIIGK